jgi:aminoglycoside N3'-acetyltransferase
LYHVAWNSNPYFLKQHFEIIVIRGIQYEDSSMPILPTSRSDQPGTMTRTVKQRVKSSHLFSTLKAIQSNVKARLRERKIRRESSLYTAEQLLADLRNMPLEKGGVVHVQSSLKAIGYVKGGADTVVEVWINRVVEEAGGTLSMPAFSVAGTMLATLTSNKVFDVRVTPTTVGRIPESFRKWPGVKRSVHPTHSVCALGSRAEFLVCEHHLDRLAFGSHSPLKRLVDLDAQLVGIGRTSRWLTSYHVFEETTKEFPFSVHLGDAPFLGKCIDWSGNLIEVPVMVQDPAVSSTRIDHPAGDWLRQFLLWYLHHQGYLSVYHFGDAELMVISARDFQTALGELLRGGITVYTTREVVERTALFESLSEDWNLERASFNPV